MAIELSFFRGDTAEMLREQGRERGREEGLAGSVDRVLRRRGISLNAEQQQRLADCHDVAKLGDWLERAAVADTAEDVFGR